LNEAAPNFRGGFAFFGENWANRQMKNFFRQKHAYNGGQMLETGVGAKKAAKPEKP
jgi:hypothetical protein